MLFEQSFDHADMTEYCVAFTDASGARYRLPITDLALRQINGIRCFPMYEAHPLLSIADVPVEVPC